MGAFGRLPSFENLEPRVFLSGVDPDAEAAVAGLGEVVPPPEPVAVVVADDFGNSPEDAQALVLRGRRYAGSACGAIDYAGDVDVLSVVATKSGVLSVIARPWADQSAVSVDLYAYDLSGSLLAHDGDPAGNSAGILFTVEQGQTYYLTVGCLGDATGPYTVSAAVVDSPPPAPDPTPRPGEQPSAGETVAVSTTWIGTGYRLVVVGTDGADTITLTQDGAGMTVTTALGTMTYSGTFSATVVYGFAGDDTIRLTSMVTAAGTIYGGDGNDSIFEAGPGSASLFGGAGDDLLVTVGGGADVLAGDLGFDSFWLDYADAVTDTSADELINRTIHQVAQFYQPTTNPAQAVPLEIAGQDLVDPVAGSAYYNYSNRPLFVDGPEYDDVRQGNLGDCYFLAALASLADSDPEAIRQMIAPMGDGTYAVRYYSGATPVYLRIDGQLPGTIFTPVYAKLSAQRETWVALAEKAYAQFRYGQNSYASLSGGWMDPVYQAVTGQGTSRVWASTPGMISTLAANLAAGHAVSAGTWSAPTGPVVGSHAYMVKAIEVVDGQTYVTVYNPWGYDGKGFDGNSADGLIQLTLEQFQNDFSSSVISLA
ncbi:MAG: hypothetical protein IMZ66_04570 [Planctomycetes bacterium]|nr:hypothetical protein [Planctomycetota bacterium]